MPAGCAKNEGSDNPQSYPQLYPLRYPPTYGARDEGQIPSRVASVRGEGCSSQILVGNTRVSLGSVFRGDVRTIGHFFGGLLPRPSSVMTGPGSLGFGQWARILAGPGAGRPQGGVVRVSVDAPRATQVPVNLQTQAV
jgi:hypothetical protein